MSLDRADWLRLIERLAVAVTYPNFKSEVAKQPSQQNKHEAYHQVWAIMHTLQAGELPDKPAAKCKARKRKAKNVPKN